MYCPEESHSTTAPLKTRQELENYWLSFFSKTQHQGLKYKISFTGGEVTVNKNFLPFVCWLQENFSKHIHSIGLTSNGSASERYYLRLIQHVDTLTFSTHSEFFNQDKFLNTVLKVAQRAQQLHKSVHVNIMDEYWAGSTVAEVRDFCLANNINHSINSINYDRRTRQSPLLRT